jgi:DNA repair and recombination protein RAD52
MAGAFSAHLINSFSTHQQRSHIREPFNTNSAIHTESQISVHGAMSFNPAMHGSFSHDTSSVSFDRSMGYMGDISEATAARIATLQAKLDRKLGPEFISQRPGPGGGPKLTYAEGWKIINLANEVFGFNGWSSSIVSLTTDFIDFSEESRRYSIGVTAIVRVTLRDGVFHEDIGYGMLENSKSKGQALDKACKPLKARALR